MIIYYYSLDTKKTKNLIYPKPFKSFLNSINIIQNSNEIPKIIASLKDKRSCFLFSIQNTSKENLCHLFESISNIRSSCIIANILVSLDKPCLKKAKDCLEAGACRVIPFTLEPQKLSEEIQSLVKQPIKTRNWLRAFQLDNVLNRNHLPSIKKLLSYKLNKRFSSLINHHKTSSPKSPLNLLSKCSSPNYITKTDVYFILETCLKTTLCQLPKAKINSTKAIKHNNSAAFELIVNYPDILTACIKENTQIVLTNQVNDLLSLPKNFILKHINCSIILISKSISLDQLNLAYNMGIFDVIADPTKHLFKAIQKAYLQMLWPYYSQHINLSTLSYAQRIIFFNDLFLRKKQMNTHINTMDIYSLFPELLKLY